MGVSLREYARRRGVSHVAVMKAIRAGRLTPEPDGTLDPAKADAQWDARTDPARRPEPPEDEPAQADETPRTSDPDKPGSVAAAARPAAAIEPAPQGAATFTQARTAHEIAKAQRGAHSRCSACARRWSTGPMRLRRCSAWRAASATPGSTGRPASPP